jgi:hypothetical protein
VIDAGRARQVIVGEVIGCARGHHAEAEVIL